MDDREQSINFIVNYIQNLCDEFEICIVVDKKTNESYVLAIKQENNIRFKEIKIILINPCRQGCEI